METFKTKLGIEYDVNVTSANVFGKELEIFATCEEGQKSFTLKLDHMEERENYLDHIFDEQLVNVAKWVDKVSVQYLCGFLASRCVELSCVGVEYYFTVHINDGISVVVTDIIHGDSTKEQRATGYHEIEELIHDLK